MEIQCNFNSFYFNSSYEAYTKDFYVLINYKNNKQFVQLKTFSYVEFGKWILIQAKDQIKYAKQL